MKHTHVMTPPADHPDLATGYTRRLPAGGRTAAPHSDGRGIAAAANMTTSATDLARFAMLQFREGAAGGAQVLKSTTLREMQRPHWVEPDWAAGWGLGFRIIRLPHPDPALPRRARRGDRAHQRRRRRAAEVLRQGVPVDGFGNHGEPVVFELDAARRVRRLKVGENYLDAIPSW
jgi:CubicO group peptidase (beta-lactamase class C family)